MTRVFFKLKYYTVDAATTLYLLIYNIKIIKNVNIL